MKRTLISALLLMAFGPIWAQHSEQEKTYFDAFNAELGMMIEIFDHELPCQRFAYYFDYADIDGDGRLEMVLTDFPKEYKSAFKYDGKSVYQVSADNVGDLDWKELKWYFTSGDTEGHPEKDITLKHRPLFGDDIDIAANRFSASSEVWTYVSPNAIKSYDRMIFKPHIGEVKLAKTKTTNKEVVYSFALINPAMTKKMFRGYASTQAAPVIVPKAFLETHTPLQYSRWLFGEKEIKANRDVKQIIQAYFGEREIYDSRWLASCEINERTFYYVVFKPQDGYVLTSLVCIAEGDVVSVCNDWVPMAPGDDDMNASGEMVEDMLFHAPQIMAMMATENGLELYTRWNSLEGIHYTIMREYIDQFVILQDDYQYLMAY
ncbi:MAG: hypothetical protein J5565_01780 [Muribaculaceae bacterium]|nr:hypothetical protein [Muribaculaceae bacterium]